jgi:hypothetical protein
LGRGASSCVLLCVCVLFPCICWVGVLWVLLPLCVALEPSVQEWEEGVPLLLGGSSLVLFSCYCLLVVVCMTMRSD